MGVGIKATDYTSSFSDSVSFVFICQTMITFVWQTHDFPLWETVSYIENVGLHNRLWIGYLLCIIDSLCY